MSVADSRSRGSINRKRARRGKRGAGGGGGGVPPPGLWRGRASPPPPPQMRPPPPPPPPPGPPPPPARARPFISPRALFGHRETCAPCYATMTCSRVVMNGG